MPYRELLILILFILFMQCECYYFQKFLYSLSQRVSYCIAIATEDTLPTKSQLNETTFSPVVAKKWKRKKISTEKFSRNPQTLDEIVKPLLDETLLATALHDWSQPLPTSYYSQPLVIVGPSGVGKNRLISMILKDYSKYFERVVTHTTRLPRLHEQPGQHYHFVNLTTFIEMNASQFFLETAKVHNNLYGVSLQAYEIVKQLNKIPILEVDIQGAYSIKALESVYQITPFYLFIAPRSIDQLQTRLLQRNTETAADIIIRLQTAVEEIQRAEETTFFHMKLINDDLHASKDALFRILRDS
jgi:guanylate kinase